MRYRNLIKIAYSAFFLIISLLCHSVALAKNTINTPNFKIEPLSRTNYEEAEVIYLKAIDYIAQGYIEQAELLLKIVLDKDPSHINSCFHLASIYDASGRSQLAKDILEQGSKLNPGVTSLGKLLATIYIKHQLPGKAIHLLTGYPEDKKIDIELQLRSRPSLS